MARKPRQQAARRKAAKPGGTARRRGVSPLAVVVFVLVLAAGAGIAWLSLTYEPPLRPGMPGNEVQLALDAPPPQPAEAAPAPPAAEAAPDAEAPAAADTGGQAPADPGDATPRDEPPQDQAPAQAAAPDQAAPSDQAAAPPADQTPAPAAAPPSEPTAPAQADTPPQGVPQRQPIGEQQAMRLDVPPPQPGVRPRIAVVLTGLGLSQAQTTAAIQALPENVTLAFSPYGDDLQRWADQAREAGHEVLLELPMEPHGFPTDDPGPHTLLTSLTEQENLERMNWVLERFDGYVGVTSQFGGRFTTAPDSLAPVLKELKQRGLLFLDTRASPDSVATELAAEAGLTHASNDVFLNEPTAARATIQAGLAELEALARERGSAIGVGYPYPVTMEMVASWARDLEGKGIELLSVSALARQPEVQ